MVNVYRLPFTDYRLPFNENYAAELQLLAVGYWLLPQGSQLTAHSSWLKGIGLALLSLMLM